MSDTQGLNEEVGIDAKDSKSESKEFAFNTGLNIEVDRIEGDLIKELEIYIGNVRRSYSNDDMFRKAQDVLFSFNVGLLCGLKQGKK